LERQAQMDEQEKKQQEQYAKIDEKARLEE
jgi:hypothetical protein